MALTVTYTYPVQGTTPPTFLESLSANMVVATVEGADADTASLITHNWKLPAVDGATYLFPTVILRQSGAGTAASTVLVALTNSLAVTFTKATGAGNSGTWVVTLMRPHSIIR